MFESADLDHKIDKAAFKKEEPKLREALLNAQYDLLRERKFATLILIAGVEGAGKGETVNLLNEWMDPRHVEVTGFPLPTDEELDRRVELCRELVKERGASLEVEAAAEGMTLTV